MKNLFNYFSGLFLSFWTGMIFFFSFVFAPIVFTVLERADAAKLQNALFPKYYALGCAFYVLIFVVQLFQPHQSSRSQPAAQAPPTTKSSTLFLPYKIWHFLGFHIAGLCFLIAYFLVLPQMQSISGGMDNESFRFLHKLSVALNASAFFGLLAAHDKRPR